MAGDAAFELDIADSEETMDEAPELPSADEEAGVEVPGAEEDELDNTEEDIIPVLDDKDGIEVDDVSGVEEPIVPATSGTLDDVDDEITTAEETEEDIDPALDD